MLILYAWKFALIDLIFLVIKLLFIFFVIKRFNNYIKKES